MGGGGKCMWETHILGGLGACSLGLDMASEQGLRVALTLLCDTHTHIERESLLRPSSGFTFEKKKGWRIRAYRLYDMVPGRRGGGCQRRTYALCIQPAVTHGWGADALGRLEDGDMILGNLSGAVLDLACGVIEGGSRGREAPLAVVSSRGSVARVGGDDPRQQSGQESGENGEVHHLVGLGDEGLCIEGEWNR